MSSKLKKLALLMAILMTGLTAQSQTQSDETLQSLENLKKRVYSVVFSVRNANMTNANRLQLIQSAKPELELELKDILRREKRGTGLDEAHDAAYEKMDELMIGLTALSILQMGPDQNTILQTSCDEAQSFLRVTSTVNGEVLQVSSHTPFVQTIKMMCAKPTNI